MMKKSIHKLASSVETEDIQKALERVRKIEETIKNRRARGEVITEDEARALRKELSRIRKRLNKRVVGRKPFPIDLRGLLALPIGIPLAGIPSVVYERYGIGRRAPKPHELATELGVAASPYLSYTAGRSLGMLRAGDRRLSSVLTALLSAAPAIISNLAMYHRLANPNLPIPHLPKPFDVSDSVRREVGGYAAALMLPLLIHNLISGAAGYALGKRDISLHKERSGRVAAEAPEYEELLKKIEQLERELENES